MRVGMAADLAVHLLHPGQDVGTGGNLPAHLKKCGDGVVLLQDVQNHIGVHRMGTVVKGQRHHRLGGIHYPDIGGLGDLAFLKSLLLCRLFRHRLRLFRRPR